MIKLNASYSKKVPADQEYSSRSFLACVEVELPTGATAQELQQKIHETFRLVEQSVEDEIAGKTANGSGKPQQRSQGKPGDPGPASNKQISYILSLGKARNKPLAELNIEVGRLYGVESVYQLTKPDASRFVDVLKQAA
ncbi:hypothetical protein PDESU_00388 [Pontiella desulfatans]|uniref:Uncharacterized protein n=1 Tax=Pontiella desulfatans TaxID=2750659 RepID=A0A6C2TWY9_PONDE|nr:hypothetical protein [Pontiella desulfatans]VGO11841.1 hypothetical protein PDESU_00388 [Pontiella desulfatans]